MAVELRGLRWAIAAAHHQSLRQAAESLNIRQSTLSRGLRDLEYQLGALLFERSNGGTRPTEAGLEFLDTARQIIAEIDTAFTRLKTHCQGETGRLTIGVCAALSAGNLRAALVEYLHHFPDVEIRTVDRSRIRLLSDLATDAIDIAIMMGQAPNWADRTLPLWNERVVAALPESHPLCARQVIQWAELKEERWLISQRDPGPEFHELLINKLGCAGLYHIMEHDVGIDRLLSLVGTGLGVTLVAEGATGAAYPRVVYREVHGESGPSRLAFVAYWRQTNSNPTFVPFLAMLRERYPDLVTPSVATGA
jgi:DNA-binding transcriptional LysR family regulator